MSITHEEARRLIQFKADEELKELDISILEAHLSSCPECQSYETSVKELEAALTPLMQRKWNQVPLPRSTKLPVSGRSEKFVQRLFFATRITAMGLICVAFLFNIWQFTRSGAQRSTPPSANIPLIPTPSLQSTQTILAAQNCEPIVYVVRPGDTVASIASQYSLSAEEILSTNNLKSEVLKTSTRLSIPVCNPTPSGTPNVLRTTYTPLLGSNTLTPVDVPTQ